MKIIAYIYQIKNKINSKFYIGSTVDYKRRWYQHKYELNNNKHDNQYLQNAWNKYGKENFEFIIIKKCNNNEQFKKEQYYFDKYKPFPPNGYNISRIAQGGCNNFGEKNHFSKYTKNQIILVKKLLCENYSVKYIHKKTKVNEESISSIKSLRTWYHIGQKYNKKLQILKEKRKKKISNIKNLNNEILEKAYLLKKQKYSSKEIHKILNCNQRLLDYPLKIYIGKKKGKKVKKCIICGKEMIVKSNNQKYCKKCAKKEKYKKSQINRKNKRLKEEFNGIK